MIKRCSKCILPEDFTGIDFDSHNECNFCKTFHKHIPFGEDRLIKYFDNAKRKKRTYDALVPLSGGKDSTYILYLATKVYKLNVLAYTYDNGFFSKIAINNIESAIKKTGVDHIFYKPNERILRNIYREALLNSGEICGVCGIGIMNSTQKISADWHIPLILLGHSPLEDNSFTSENIYDSHRLRVITSESGNISKKEFDQFLIYPKMNYINTYFHTLTGKFGKKINPLYFLEVPTDIEIGEIIKREMGWTDKSDSDFSKHLDCWAEPFTNYVREKRFGHSRRISQLSNMIRLGEITREKALEIHEKDHSNTEPLNTEQVLSALNITRDDLNKVFTIPSGKYNAYLSRANKIFAWVKTQSEILKGKK